MQSLHKNKTWEVVPLLVGKTAIGCKWVYKRKEDPSKPDKVRFRARLVVKGFAQKEGVDYNEIFFSGGKTHFYSGAVEFFSSWRS